MSRGSAPSWLPRPTLTPALPGPPCAATSSPCRTGARSEGLHLAHVRPAGACRAALVFRPAQPPAPVPGPGHAATAAPAVAPRPRARQRLRAVAAVGAVRRLPPLGPFPPVPERVA